MRIKDLCEKMFGTQVFIYNGSILLFKGNSNDVPEWLQTRFVKFMDIHARNTGVPYMNIYVANEIKL